MSQSEPVLHYHATSFSQGRMDFTWAELSEAERRQADADWAAGKGLIGGDPQQRPGSRVLPEWGLDQPFFRALALDDDRGRNGATLRELLASDRSVEVEIGFGRGDFLLDRAQRHPDRLLVGFETKTKATRLMLARIDKLALGNLWVSDDDGRFALPRVVEDGRLDAVHILFPDPWWKAQHKVKRLMSPPMVELLANKLRPGGLLHFKSDVREYGELVAYLVAQHAAFGVHDPALVATLVEVAPTHREYWCARHQRPVYTYCFARR